MLKTRETDKPLVSVIIPNFNYGNFLSEAITSVIHQTYSNWEIIVVDNFSTDESEVICAQFDLGSKLSFIKYANNGIVASSRNVGLKASSGELIAFLDSDDFWFPKKLEIAVEAHLVGAEVTYHKVKLVDKNSNVLYPRRFTRSRQLKTPISEDLLLRGNALINSSVVAASEIVKQVGYLDELPQMAGAEDLNLWLRISKQTENFVRLPGLLGAYRSHGSSLSNSKEGKQDRSISAIDSFLELYPLLEQKHSGLNHLLNARNFINKGNFGLATLHLSRALKIGSLEVRARALFLCIFNYQSLKTHLRNI